MAAAPTFDISVSAGTTTEDPQVIVSNMGGSRYEERFGEDTADIEKVMHYLFHGAELVEDAGTLQVFRNYPTSEAMAQADERMRLAHPTIDDDSLDREMAAQADATYTVELKKTDFVNLGGLEAYVEGTNSPAYGLLNMTWNDFNSKTGSMRLGLYALACVRLCHDTDEDKVKKRKEGLFDIYETTRDDYDASDFISDHDHSSVILEVPENCKTLERLHLDLSTLSEQTEQHKWLGVLQTRFYLLKNRNSTFRTLMKGRSLSEMKTLIDEVAKATKTELVSVDRLMAMLKDMASAVQTAQAQNGTVPLAMLLTNLNVSMTPTAASAQPPQQVLTDTSTAQVVLSEVAFRTLQKDNLFMQAASAIRGCEASPSQDNSIKIISIVFGMASHAWISALLWPNKARTLQKYYPDEIDKLRTASAQLDVYFRFVHMSTPSSCALDSAGILEIDIGPFDVAGLLPSDVKRSMPRTPMRMLRGGRNFTFEHPTTFLEMSLDKHLEYGTLARALQNMTPGDFASEEWMLQGTSVNIFAEIMSMILTSIGLAPYALVLMATVQKVSTALQNCGQHGTTKRRWAQEALGALREDFKRVMLSFKAHLLNPRPQPGLFEGDCTGLEANLADMKKAEGAGDHLRTVLGSDGFDRFMVNNEIQMTDGDEAAENNTAGKGTTQTTCSATNCSNRTRRGWKLCNSCFRKDDPKVNSGSRKKPKVAKGAGTQTAPRSERPKTDPEFIHDRYTLKKYSKDDLRGQYAEAVGLDKASLNRKNYHILHINDVCLGDKDEEASREQYNLAEGDVKLPDKEDWKARVEAMKNHGEANQAFWGGGRS